MEPRATRTLDEFGRIVLPGDLREELGWHKGDVIEICKDGDKITLQLQEKHDG